MLESGALDMTKHWCDNQPTSRCAAQEVPNPIPGTVASPCDLL